VKSFGNELDGRRVLRKERRGRGLEEEVAERDIDDERRP
jgi:hypothetical protein